MAAAKLFPMVRHLYERSTRWTGPKLGPPAGVVLPPDDEPLFHPHQELGAPLDLEMPDFSDVDGDEHAVKEELLSPLLRPATPIDQEPLPPLEEDASDRPWSSGAAVRASSTAPEEASSSTIGASYSSSASATVAPQGTAPLPSAPAALSTSTLEVARRPSSLREILEPRGAALSFAGHHLPAFDPPEDKAAMEGYVWPPHATDAWRSYFAWDWAEIFFRYEVFRLDHLLRTTHTDIHALCAETTMQRQLTVCRVWESDGFVPSGRSPLTRPNWTERESCVRAFHHLVRSWPRTDLDLAPDQFDHEADFLAFERKVWLAYAQTYYDYYGRTAPLPSPCPTAPWADEHVSSSHL